MHVNTVFPDDWLAGLAVVLLFSFLSYFSKKIDGLGSMVGGVIAFSIFLGGAWPALLLLFLFFVLGSAASSWKYHTKVKLGLAEKNKGQRTSINALSNGGVAALCGLLAFLIPEIITFNLMLAASLASATSDTLSSELGNVYGKKYVNILKLKPDVRGNDGAISLEGTLIGLIGSAFIAISYGLVSESTSIGVIVMIGVSGFVGNLMDSVLGASLQKSGRLTNHGVNFVSTLFAALFAGGLWQLLSY